MKMSHYTDEPRFTIEQIDMLQRLRRSGMTRQDILHALDTLERLDREHVEKFGHRHVSGANHTNSSNASTSSNPCTTSSNNLTASSSTTSTATQTSFRGSGLSPSPSNSYDTSPPPTVPTSTPVVAPLIQNGRDGIAAFTNGKLSPPRFTVSSISSRAFPFEHPDEEMDIDDRVEELMRMDSAILKEEIKAFLGNRRISQAVVAQVTGISQSRISHWLLQQGSDLSEQKKRAFYRWYQLEKTNPVCQNSESSNSTMTVISNGTVYSSGATLAMRPAPVVLEEMLEWRQTPPPISSTQGSFRLRQTQAAAEEDEDYEEAQRH
ncbi:hypothetical protein DNTS_024218 [Danionella cerebrum]|uniref:Uncharacterized protein n=1 Tax=Danionella cerebrum TaxID=2873325 RepID=A0A553N2Z6_9TELE|nr:hypothetical protein DNTS_024218 [Danionella translucida]